MGFEHAFLSQMGEKLPARHILHEKVNIFGVLVDAFEVDLAKWKYTMKGWEMDLRI